jgi:hypothetical protein
MGLFWDQLSLPTVVVFTCMTDFGRLATPYRTLETVKTRSLRLFHQKEGYNPAHKRDDRTYDTNVEEEDVGKSVPTR